MPTPTARTLNRSTTNVQVVGGQQGGVQEGAEGRALNAVRLAQGHPVQHDIVVERARNLLQAHGHDGSAAHHAALEASLHAHHGRNGSGNLGLVAVALVGKVVHCA